MQECNSPMPQVPSAKPDNMLIWSILATFLCCLPFGVVAIIKSSSVDTLWVQGRYDEARQAADSAKKWCILSVVCGVILTVIYVALNVLAGLAA